MIEVRTGIRKTYRWRLGASRLSQASGRNPNRTDSEPTLLLRALRSIPACYRDPQRTTALPWDVLGGRSPVGITSTGGSVQNEAHTGKTASANDTAGPGIRGPDSAPPHAQHPHLPTRISLVRRGRTLPAGTPRCSREARPCTWTHGGQGNHHHRPVTVVSSGGRPSERDSGQAGAGTEDALPSGRQQRPPAQRPQGPSGPSGKRWSWRRWHVHTGHAHRVGKVATVRARRPPA